MANSSLTPIYSQNAIYANTRSAIPIIQNRDPQPYDINLPLGIRWINETTGGVFVFTNIYEEQNGSLFANWQLEIGSLAALSSISVDSGTNPVTTSNNNIVIGGDGSNISTYGGEYFLNIDLDNSVSVNNLTLNGIGSALKITSKSTSTSCVGQATTSSGSVTVTNSILTTNSIILVSPIGQTVNNNNGTFTITKPSYAPSGEIVYSYWIIN